MKRGNKSMKTSCLTSPTTHPRSSAISTTKPKFRNPSFKLAYEIGLSITFNLGFNWSTEGLRTALDQQPLRASCANHLREDWLVPFCGFQSFGYVCRARFPFSIDIPLRFRVDQFKLLNQNHQRRRNRHFWRGPRLRTSSIREQPFL